MPYHAVGLPQGRFSSSVQVRREVLAAMDPSSGHLDPSAADKRLPMVDACIREAQRLYPVAPFVVRHLESDLRLKDGKCTWMSEWILQVVSRPVP